MSKASSESDSAEMRDEYDFSSGTRGKYSERYKRGSNVVVIDPDVSDEFPNAVAVNNALRRLRMLETQSRQGGVATI